MTNVENKRPGRPKVLGTLTAFNTKLQEETKVTLEAIQEVGPFTSYRDMIESWTADYLERNPEVAKKVKSYQELLKI